MLMSCIDSNVHRILGEYSIFKSKEDLYKILENAYSVDLSDRSINPREELNSISNRILYEKTIKASFVKNVLFKLNNNISIFELNVGENRVDLCSFGRTSSAFEIKTDFDNLSRLDKQITRYLSVFNKVYIVCSYRKLNQIIKQASPLCGVYCYDLNKNNRIKFCIERNATNSTLIEPRNQLELLSKHELTMKYNVDRNAKKKDMIEYILKNYTDKRIDEYFRQYIMEKYKNQWNFLRENHDKIYEIDYQWFYKNMINPDYIYK